MFPQVKIGIVHNSFSPTLKHFIIKENMKQRGFGSSHNILLALEKAYSEFIERVTLEALYKQFDDFTSSNGFASHVSSHKAYINSREELIERDAFLMCWHAKVGPYWISNADSLRVLSDENKQIFLKHSKLNLQIQIGIVSITGNYITAIGCVRSLGNADFFYIDCKTGQNLGEISNLLVESISFHSHYIELGYLKAIKNKKTRLLQPMDHFNYHLKVKHDLTWFFKGSKSVIKLLPEKIETYNCNPEDVLNIAPINRFVFYSESLGYQNYYCGKPNQQSVNIKRYSRVFSRDKIKNLIPHPLS